ncbi:MAG: RlpA-like double-psi beta-barrel domain-containing protein [Acidobacteriota bacterium]|nr:RlpA-like double-psi beta-barrel domain-containing protein [Acidobacteriota bacterium]
MKRPRTTALRRTAWMHEHGGLITPGLMAAMLAVVIAGSASGAYAAGAGAGGAHRRLRPSPHTTGRRERRSRGGTGLPGAHPAPRGPAGGPAGAPAPSPLDLHVSVASVELNVLRGGSAHVNGSIRPALAGLTVALQVRGRHGWIAVARTLTGPRGRFHLGYVPRGLGSRPVRLRVHSDGAAGALVAGGCMTLGCPAPIQAPSVLGPMVRNLGRLNVYREAVASWYGGGGSLACGGYLTSSTMGVANRTLPCGTMVTLRYGSRAVRVPVVDRGPFVEGREFDLTEATKNALGFPGLGVVWSTA